jgi:hypothetical protein
VSTTLARKFKIDVTTDLTLAGGWLALNGVDDFNPSITPATEDTSAYDTTGWTTKEITMQDWSAVAQFFRRVTSGTYDAGQELVRACVGQFGTAARCGVRWYDRNGGPEAYSGVALVQWARTNTAVANVEKATVTFMATDIPLNLNIINPYNVALAPVVAGASPSAAAATTSIAIFGQYFTGTVGASHVTIGGTNATSYSVINDGLISAVMPAGSAGSAPIVVTNAVGASNSFPYTRGA